MPGKTPTPKQHRKTPYAKTPSKATRKSERLTTREEGFYNEKTLVKRAAVDREGMKNGWEKFGAEESTHNDGKPSTTVKIILKRGSSVTGTTGKGRGHAEMHALTQILESKGSAKEFVKAIKGAKVTCEEKPCCLRCAAVLGLLGIEPKSDATRKNKAGMGSTQWSVSDGLRETIQAITGVDVREFHHWSSYDKL